jgi:hypothetical protein
MEQERDREQSAARAASEAAALASTIEEAELHRAEVAAQDAIVQNLRDEVDRIRTQKFLLRSLIAFILLWIGSDRISEVRSCLSGFAMYVCGLIKL